MSYFSSGNGQSDLGRQFYEVSLVMIPPELVSILSNKEFIDDNNRFSITPTDVPDRYCIKVKV